MRRQVRNQLVPKADRDVRERQQARGHPGPTESASRPARCCCRHSSRRTPRTPIARPHEIAMERDASADLKAYYRDLYPYATLVSLLELTARSPTRNQSARRQRRLGAPRRARVPHAHRPPRVRAHVQRTNCTTGAKFTVPREVREMHIGAAYTGRARPGVRGELHSNELVLDYDITDCDFLRLEGQPQSRIDERRSWSSASRSPSPCWRWSLASTTPLAFLVQCAPWVFDDSAVCLGDLGRAAVLAYATLKTERDGGPMCTQMYEHPNAQRFFPQCREFFKTG